MSSRRSPPPASAHARPLPAQRLLGLSPTAATRVREAALRFGQGDLAAAELALLAAMVTSPEHPEVLRWSGAIQARRGRLDEAAASFRHALAQRADDAETMCLLASAEYGLGDDAGALDRLRRATALARDADTWLRLGLEFDRQGHEPDALAAADQVLAREPGNATARLLRARCLQALGQAAAAAAEYRALVARRQHVASAWYALLDQKTVAIDASELQALQREEQLAARTASTDDRAMLAFALGKACEDAGRLEEAYAAFERANALARIDRPWDGAAFSREVTQVMAAFDPAPAPADPAPGAGLVFVVGLPRSGTTLIEQVLAAHPQVEGASELPYLQIIVGEESRRRQQAFPQWARTATPADWSRLGREYLQATARWRRLRPVSTDKMPSNWLLAGAALAMLPQARVVACLRDPLETCWSCYKQLFARDKVGFAYDFESLAAYSRDCDRLCRFWAERYPRQFRLQRYEAYVAEPEAQTRELLDFCDLPFDGACLRFHEARRSVRSASAAQVRQPLRGDTARAARYGEMLAPLRALLEAPPDAAGA